jgi:hypothetical protein
MRPCMRHLATVYLKYLNIDTQYNPLLSSSNISCPNGGHLYRSFLLVFHRNWISDIGCNPPTGHLVQQGLKNPHDYVQTIPHCVHSGQKVLNNPYGICTINNVYQPHCTSPYVAFPYVSSPYDTSPYDTSPYVISRHFYIPVCFIPEVWGPYPGLG